VQSIAHFAAVGDGGPRSIKAELSCARGGPEEWRWRATRAKGRAAERFGV